MYMKNTYKEMYFEQIYKIVKECEDFRENNTGSRFDDQQAVISAYNEICEILGFRKEIFY